MQISLGDARDQLSKLVEDVLDGKAVTITRRGVPVVEMVRAKPVRARRFGTLKGLVVDPDWNRPQDDVEAWMKGDV